VGKWIFDISISVVRLDLELAPQAYEFGRFFGFAVEGEDIKRLFGFRTIFKEKVRFLLYD
jgi:hypothetical protein